MTVQFTMVSLLLVLIATWFPVAALLQQSFLSFEPAAGSLNLSQAPIILSQSDYTGVHIATANLARDLEATIDHLPKVYNLTTTDLLPGDSIPVAIIIGSITESDLIKTLVERGKVDLKSITGKWESFSTQIVDDPILGIERALVVAGSDKRGTIFGIYTISELAGQSPYHWWADVPAKKHAHLYALPITTRHGEPSVKYRGLFINDEAPALESWWSAKFGVDKAPLNSEFYSHVFELLLRLKANFMWPAMWSSWPKPGNIFFSDDPLNLQTAHDYGIVISTSHHEPMQRATNEWLSSDRGDWDWTQNKKNMTTFMEEGVRRSKDFETIHTVGLRGAADARIKGHDPITIIKDVFKVQRSIIERFFGHEGAARQAWTIYKEVATYYAAGLEPPEDVTLILPDDNWGNVQRLPTSEESLRKGGSGVYFHLEYVGVPIAYKWTNNNALPKILKDISHVSQAGANEIWVVNVGDIKPMEIPFAFIMDYAWNSSSIDFGTLPDYLTQFAIREFGADHGPSIGKILMDLDRLIALRKFEAVREDTFSYTHYDEADRILTAWQSLLEQSELIYDLMSSEYRPAYFELVHYPVKSGYIYYNIMLNMGKNHLYGQERRNSANDVAEKVLQFFDDDYDLTAEFDTLLSGKWRNMMRQCRYDFNNSWVPPSRDTIPRLSYVQRRQNTVPALGNLGVVAEGMNSTLTGRWCEVCQNSKPMVDGLYRPVLPSMNPYSPTSHIDLFMRGDFRVPIEWSASTDVPWLNLEPSTGTLDQYTPDLRVNVSIKWDLVPVHFDDTVLISITSTQRDFELVNLTVTNLYVPELFSGFPETGAGLLSIEAAHYDSLRHATTADIHFEPIPFLGTRTNSGSLALRPFVAARADRQSCKLAAAIYSFYLFAPAPQLRLTAYFNMALDTDPKRAHEFSLTLDNAPSQFQRLIRPAESPGGLPPGWSKAVLDGAWEIALVFENVGAGEHTLKFSANGPEVVLEKLVLSREELPKSYLGPPETMKTGAGQKWVNEEVQPVFGEMEFDADYYRF